jgi:protein-S-isoprenylcysteine O-methyltransferase Ste14
MEKGYLILVGMHFAGLLIRVIYEKFKKKSRIDMNSKIVFAIVFVAMCLMWASWFSMCPEDPLKIALPNMVRWIGFGLFLIGLGLVIGAVVQLKGVENIDHLVTTGLFSKFRHPMYTGFILWIFGWGTYHGAALSMLIGLFAVDNILCWRRQEEDELASKYGETYIKYRKQTWF